MAARPPIVEPSEIITGREELLPLNHPLLRLVARYFDYALFFSLLYFIPWRPAIDRWLPLEYLAWVPIETLLLWAWGTTPGKALLQIKVQRGVSGRLPFECAWKRSAFVWIRGMGCGIPLLNFFCMAFAYYRLRTLRVTSWDHDVGTKIFYRALPQWRFVLGACIAALGWGFYLLWKNGYV